jgi:mRNA interferase MazF
MPSTTTYKRGDIVLVPFPFTDLSSSKKRPALIISPDSFNAANQDVVLVAITSQIGNDPQAVVMREGDFVDGKLPKLSMIRIGKVFTIHSALIVKRLCAVTTPKLQEILRAIRDFYS